MVQGTATQQALVDVKTPRLRGDDDAMLTRIRAVVRLMPVHCRLYNVSTDAADSGRLASSTTYDPALSYQTNQAALNEARREWALSGRDLKRKWALLA